jgi:hypothetical protein
MDGAEGDLGVAERSSESERLSPGVGKGSAGILDGLGRVMALVVAKASDGQFVAEEAVELGERLARPWAAADRLPSRV